MFYEVLKKASAKTSHCEKLAEFEMKNALSQALALSCRTQSLWTHMDAHLEDYLNPFYEVCLHLYILSNITDAWPN